MMLSRSAPLLCSLKSVTPIPFLLLASLPAIAATTADIETVKNASPPRIQSGVSPRQVRAAGQQPTCSGVPLPDIEAANVSISGSGKQGKVHTVNVGVVNRGQCATGKFSIRASLRIQATGVDKTIDLGRKGAPSLQPCRKRPCNSSHSVSFRFTPAYNHALYTVSVDVDDTESINEFREDNNQIVDELRIQNN